MKIASFTIEFYDEVFTLWQQCDGIGPSSADSYGNIQRYLERNPNMSFIATINGKIVGTILAGYDGDVDTFIIWQLFQPAVDKALPSSLSNIAWLH